MAHEILIRSPVAFQHLVHHFHLEPSSHNPLGRSLNWNEIDLSIEPDLNPWKTRDFNGFFRPHEIFPMIPS